MKTHISTLFGLNITSHSQIEFVDIRIDKDTKLFIDPCLIDIRKDKWSLAAKLTIDNYYKKLYSIYRNRKNDIVKLNLFAHSHEINDTRFGYGNGSNGKAKTPEGMLETFKGMDNLFLKRVNLTHPIDLSLFIQDFAEDCLSDMLTNILFKVLNDFTLEQCEKYGFKTMTPAKKYYYWDREIGDWKTYEGKCMVYQNKVFLLVPKWFVRQRFYYNINQYFSMVILEKLKEDNTVVDMKGKVFKPAKKTLRGNILHKNPDILSASINYTKENPDLLNGYHSQIPLFYSNRGMTDDNLDKILYHVA